MKTYSHYGFNEFIICCGYKGEVIKEYFLHYNAYQSDCTFSLKNEGVDVHKSSVEPWKVTLANTGLETLTAGRILKIKEYIDEDEFLLTYGDGVSDVNIQEAIDFHHKMGKIATITTTQPPGRFGALKLDVNNSVRGFKEKAREDQAWVNIGFMVLNRKIFDYLGDGSEMLEQTPFEQLAKDGEMTAYKHKGFWSPMDTIHDKEYLERLWREDRAPWKV